MQGFLVGRESNRKDAERPKFEPREDGHARISVPASDGPFRCQVRQTAGELAPRKSFNGLVYTICLAVQQQASRADLSVDSFSCPNPWKQFGAT